ncbi:hypothetical protein [Saccharibacillus alkalitolerans]|uniref:Uncharacterized protein n=1 Tax=Saccharibacillus alkalitolerans TaxID=2705290 RepID=A0ABX0FE53_9BACL|nr:hypothetical protein [Saccharibacillus alkalitolerans]NGZ78221.1 hypothetical protein [Saccharibacillus alkalitolerans]
MDNEHHKAKEREEAKATQQSQKDDNRQGPHDHAEQYPTGNESLFDMHESEMNVDPLPMEDISMEQQEEKNKDGTRKSRSSSDDKYKSGF